MSALNDLYRHSDMASSYSVCPLQIMDAPMFNNIIESMYESYESNKSSKNGKEMEGDNEKDAFVSDADRKKSRMITSWQMWKSG